MKPKSRIEYNSKSDERGRCSFTLYRWANYHPGDPEGEYRKAERAQCYHADPRDHGHLRPEDVIRDVEILT